MNKKNLIWIAVAGVAIWYFMKNKKKPMTTASGSTGSGTTASLTATGDTARQLVDAAIDQTTFVADNTTDMDRYQKDKSACL